MSAVDHELVPDFLLEGHEHVDGLEADLVSLERNPGDAELVARIFRHVHTLKGAAGFVGFAELGRVTHAAENLLAQVRGRQRAFDHACADALLALADVLRLMLAKIEADGDDDVACAELIERLERLTRDAPSDAPDSAPGGEARVGELLISAGAARAADVEATLKRQNTMDPGRADTTIRVDTATLDELMYLTSELVLTRNALLAAAEGNASAGLGRAVQRLARVTAQLQGAVTSSRMQPIAGVWQKLPRVVRDLAAACGKQVRLDVDGGDTELDKAVLEAISDPLTHLVRNAVDHGIETPQCRVAAGKPAEGVLSLRAFHEHGRVNVELADDGGGIDPGLLVAAFRRHYPDRPVPADTSALLALVFLPGVSTAEQVSNVSGRGVGMDVVRTQVERVGGTVELASTPGAGTTITLRVPLTTAIMPALLVKAGGQRYAVPQVHAGEIVGLAKGTVERAHDAAVLRHRGGLLPLVDLAELFALPAGRGHGAGNAVILNGDVPFALAVDGVTDVAEIVVKPLPAEVRRLGLFTGATVLDDGQVALILDMSGIAKQAGAVGARKDAPTASTAVGQERPTGSTVLLVTLPGGHRCALPLQDVARLEEVHAADVEHVSGREAVRYGGGVLRLVRLDEALYPGTSARDAERLQIVVHAAGEHLLGFVVERVLDVHADVRIMPVAGDHPVVTGTAVLDGLLTDVLDVGALCRSAEGRP